MKKNTNIVCIDSQILSRALKGEPNSGDVEVDNAIRFVNFLDKQNKKILVATPVLTELTWTSDETKRKKVIQIVTSRWIVSPFDAKAADICSMILNTYKTNNNYQEILNTITKRKLKYDALIAAVAIANNCECIYTNDSDYNLVKPFIIVKEMPIIPKQITMFDDYDIEVE